MKTDNKALFEALAPDSFQDIFLNSGSVMIIVDDNLMVVTSNLNGNSYFGIPEKKLINSKHWLDLLSIEDQERIRLYMEGYATTKCTSQQFECVLKDNSQKIYYLQKKISQIRNTSLFLIAVSDVTIQKITEMELKKSQQLASFYEFHDHLTQLPNRELFLSRLEMELRSSHRRRKTFAVLCIGIDRLKAINEIYGPSNGDQVLRAIGTELNALYRNDDFVSRFEGDKFMVLLSDLKSSDHVIRIVDKTFNIFEDPVPICGDEVTLSASIGISIYPTDGTSAQEICKNAETAMFIAKEKKRGGYQIFDTTMHAQIENRFRLTQEMMEGIAKGEFIAYYQPKVDNNGILAGMEALVRWQNPRRGLMFPEEFIALAEDNGMIIEIGYQILTAACKQALDWHNRGAALIQVAVNLSPVQFSQPDLVAKIREILKVTGLPPQYLELEITETGIIQQEEAAIKKMKKLMDLGLDIAIDDFGTGYSSLYRLQDYPVTRLKIDKIFLDSIHSNPKTTTITNSIIKLAHKLGFQVVAEGIEHDSQYSLLKNHLCDYFQGYFFDEPLHPEVMGQNWLMLK
ncbi:MAG: EAL domain-containing protein [Spirochaetales bacterium]|nr:EAL domain-containing protein [Spirochaetales bacterium]